MGKKILIILIVLNVAALSWGVHDFYFLKEAKIDDLLVVDAEGKWRTSEILNLFEKFSEDQKIERVQDILELYKNKMEFHNTIVDLLKETNNQMYHYLYLFLALSFVNIIFILVIIKRKNNRRSPVIIT